MSNANDTDPNTTSDDTGRRPIPATFGQRHGLTILGIVMALLFVVVITAQVAC